MSLAGRLTELLDGCPPLTDALDRHGTDVDTLMRAVRDARNALTHEGPGSDRLPLDAAGMFWTSRTLGWLIRHYLMEELGLDTGLCRDLLERNPGFDRSVQRTAEHL